MMLSLQIPYCAALREVNYNLTFPDRSCPATNTPPGLITVIVETGSTALDVMIAAADKDSSYNFKSTYYGNSGYFIDAVNGTENKDPCYWFFYYIIPGLSPQRSQFGVSNVVVPGNGFTVILSYMSYSPSENESTPPAKEL